MFITFLFQIKIRWFFFFQMVQKKEMKKRRSILDMFSKHILNFYTIFLYHNSFPIHTSQKHIFKLTSKTLSLIITRNDPLLFKYIINQTDEEFGVLGMWDNLISFFPTSWWVFVRELVGRKEKETNKEKKETFW